MADRTVRITSDFKRVMSHAEARCRNCGWTVIFPPFEAAALFVPAVSLEEAGRRLKCRRCGAKDARLRALRKEFHG